MSEVHIVDTSNWVNLRDVGRPRNIPEGKGHKILLIRSCDIHCQSLFVLHRQLQKKNIRIS